MFGIHLIHEEIASIKKRRLPRHRKLRMVCVIDLYHIQKYLFLEGVTLGWENSINNILINIVPRSV